MTSFVTRGSSSRLAWLLSLSLPASRLTGVGSPSQGVGPSEPCGCHPQRRVTTKRPTRFSSPRRTPGRPRALRALQTQLLALRHAPGRLPALRALQSQLLALRQAPGRPPAHRAAQSQLLAPRRARLPAPYRAPNLLRAPHRAPNLLLSPHRGPNQLPPNSRNVSCLSPAQQHRDLAGVPCTSTAARPGEPSRPAGLDAPGAGMRLAWRPRCRPSRCVR
jgi:hypothetical protein